MTTICCDLYMMAADKRCTHGYQRFSSRKIFRIKNQLIGVAGDGGVCEEFLLWLKGKGPAPKKLDEFDALLLNKSGIYVYASSIVPQKVEDNFYAIGSGGGPALGAMHMGADPRKAVKIAAKIDPSTGDGITSFRLPGG